MYKLFSILVKANPFCDRSGCVRIRLRQLINYRLYPATKYSLHISEMI